MSISRYSAAAGVEVLTGLLALAHVPVELAKDEMAVGDERAMPR